MMKERKNTDKLGNGKILDPMGLVNPVEITYDQAIGAGKQVIRYTREKGLSMDEAYELLACLGISEKLGKKE